MERKPLDSASAYPTSRGSAKTVVVLGKTNDNLSFTINGSARGNGRAFDLLENAQRQCANLLAEDFSTTDDACATSPVQI
jgi:hypothetical protein